MITQKVIKIGNSYGVIIPIDILKSVNLKVGDEIILTLDKTTKTILITPKKFYNKKMKTFEFYTRLNEFTERNKDLLKELAKY